MTKNYTQLSLVQRYQIQSLWVAGMTQKFISNQLAVYPSTFCRELDRNTAKRGRTSGHYVATNAQRKTDQRHQNKPKQVLLSLAMKQLIVKQLTEDKWSPELISAKGNETGKCPLSHEWIYQWIWACKHGNKKEDNDYKQLYKHLRHGRRRRKRENKKDNRGIIQHRKSIEDRPTIVNKRERLGDIEVDLMMGKNHKGALLFMTDRACLYT